MDIPRHTTNIFRTAAFFGGLSFSLLSTAEEPLPTPTPRSGTLAAYASVTPLDRTCLVNEMTTVVITGDNLAELGEGAVLTVVAEPAAEFVAVDLPEPVDSKTRERWRNKVMAQRKVIERLDARRKTVEAEIDRLERGGLDSRTLDRLEKAESKLGRVDSEIRRERLELSRIIRRARKVGAQPGWFR
jgi:hypothetical protein